MCRVSLARWLIAALPEIQHVVLAVDLGDRQHQLTEPVLIKADVILAAKTIVVVAILQRANHVEVKIVVRSTFSRLPSSLLVPGHNVRHLPVAFDIGGVARPDDEIERKVSTVGLEQAFQCLTDILLLAAGKCRHVDNHEDQTSLTLLLSSSYSRAGACRSIHNVRSRSGSLACWLIKSRKLVRCVQPGPGS